VAYDRDPRHAAVDPKGSELVSFTVNEYLFLAVADVHRWGALMTPKCAAHRVCALMLSARMAESDQQGVLIYYDATAIKAGGVAERIDLK
jgi:hypothetical protein